MDPKTNLFIEKANIKHNNKYDYSLTKYTGTYNELIIICPIHNQFTQIAKNHLSGSGCKQCAKADRVITNQQKYGGHPQQNPEIRNKTKQTNLERYGVENPQQVKEINAKSKQTNLKKYGSKTNRAKAIQTNLERYGVRHATTLPEVKEKKLNTWNQKYGVDNPRKSPEIKEKIKQTWIAQYGCHPKQTLQVQEKYQKTCLDKYGVDYSWNHQKIKQTNLERYGVENHNQKHLKNILPLINSPEWLFEQYIIQNKTAIQIAQENNISDVSIGKYLKKAEIQIKKTYQSFISKQWLQSLNIPDLIYEYQWNENNLRTKADGYCPSTNTIYEFHGDYWHGNPDIYAVDIIHPIIKKSMGELYQKTIEREQQIKSLGYKLVVMWENNFNPIIT